jgi:hypothetical protein
MLLKGPTDVHYVFDETVRYWVTISDKRPAKGDYFKTWDYKKNGATVLGPTILCYWSDK